MLIERNRNIWDFHDRGHWIVITTNTVVKKSDEAVMGAGIALQAASKFPELSATYGKYLRNTPLDLKCRVFPYYAEQLFLLPTKLDWRDKSDISLIQDNVLDLRSLWYKLRGYYPEGTKVYLPALGCNLGRLDWEKDVEPVISPLLDDQFIAIINDKI